MVYLRSSSCRYKIHYELYLRILQSRMEIFLFRVIVNMSDNHDNYQTFVFDRLTHSNFDLRVNDFKGYNTVCGKYSVAFSNTVLIVYASLLMRLT